MKTHCSNRNEEITSASIVCFIEIDSINIDATIYNTAQRVISREDNARLICCSRSVIEKSKFVALSCREMVRLTAVAVCDVCPCGTDVSHELIAELISEQDARRNHNDGAGSVLQQVTSVLDHDDCLAAARGDDHLPVTSGAESVESAGLVGTESDQNLVFVVKTIINAKPAFCKAGVCQLVNRTGDHAAP